MAIAVNFYTFKKRINSTMRPENAFPAVTPAATYNCILKAGCDIMSPIISLDYGINNNPTALNYAYIPDFNRYYFVKTWQWEERLWNIYLEEDVLATARDTIKNSTGYVLRCSSDYDGTIMDELYPTKPAALVRNTSPDHNPWAYGLSGGRFIVGIINRDNDAQGAVSYYVMTNAQFKTLCNILLDNTNWPAVPGDILDGGIDENLLKTLFNPIQYIASVKWVPFIPAVTTNITQISYGWWSFSSGSNVIGSRLNLASPYTDSFRFVLPTHPQASRGSYLNCAPYTRHTLSAGPFGEIALDPDEFPSGEVICDLVVDCISCIGKLFITSSRTLGTYYRVISADMGVDVQIAQIGVDRLSQWETIASGAVDVAAGSLGTAATATNIKNLVNPVGGVLNAASQGAQTVSTGIHAIGNGIRSSMPQLQSTGVNGSMAAYYLAPFLKTTTFELVEEDITEKGRPLAQTRSLANINGYVMLESGDVAAAGFGGTVNEQAAVKAYLESGCFLA